MDEDLDSLSREQLINEVKILRQGIREHRDSSGHNLCWHHPELWGLLPEPVPSDIAVPPWPKFMAGCVAYRHSLDKELPYAPVHDEDYQSPVEELESRSSVDEIGNYKNTTEIDYDGRTFIAVSNSESGEVSNETVFHYHQEGHLFWAEYSGGDIRKGTMIGLVHQNGNLDFLYQHLNASDMLRSGKCSSVPEVLPNNLIRLHEKWRWNDGSGESGSSIVEERPNKELR